MKIETCSFIPISSIWDTNANTEFARNAFNAASENFDFTWGSNNRSLVDAFTFGEAVAESLDYPSRPEEGEESSDEWKAYREIEELLSVMTSMGVDYIDLEN
jgi:hypothetical protein